MQRQRNYSEPSIRQPDLWFPNGKLEAKAYVEEHGAKLEADAAEAEESKTFGFETTYLKMLNWIST